MSWLPATATLIGGIAEGVGGFMSANSQYDAAKYNASVAQQNAAATRQGAVLTEYQARKSLRQATGTQKAMYAKSGVESLTGSPLDVMRDSVMEGELSIAVDNYNSEIQARSFQADAEQRLYLAKQDRQLAYVKSGLSLLKTGIEYGTKMNWGKKKIGE
jgi:hypothetical protein